MSSTKMRMKLGERSSAKLVTPKRSRKDARIGFIVKVKKYSEK
jgi:hypothetical protein